MIDTAQHTRRDFFAGAMPNPALRRSSAFGMGFLGDLLGLSDSLLKMKRQAMNAIFEVITPLISQTSARETGLQALDEIDHIEELLTIWRGFSELAALNQNAASQSVAVSPELFEVLLLAQRVHRETQGAYDITSTPLSRCWGFFEKSGRKPEPEDLQTARECVSFNSVCINKQNRRVRFKKPGIELNPASIGKGYALDRALAVARHNGLENVLLNGGFSSALAHGSPFWQEGWHFDIRNPFDHSCPLARVCLKDRGFSSSGNELQHFEYQGKTYGHIIDPRSGYPVTHFANVNVLAPTAAEAEAYATAFYVMQFDEIQALCARRPELEVLILHTPDEDGRTKLSTINLKPESAEVMYDAKS